jgi:hypothetical protein
MDRPNTFFAKYKICYRLLGDLDDLIAEKKSKAEFQDVVRRLFIVVAMIFMRDERSLAGGGRVDARSRKQLHSRILAKYIRISDEFDKATRRKDWIACASQIGRELAKDLQELKQ